MKIIMVLSVALSFLLPHAVLAETEDEEMARMQRELNKRLFEPEKKVVAPVSKKVEVQVESSGDVSVGSFSDYRLAGVTLGMDKSAVISQLESEGYVCNMPQMAGMLQMIGRSVCAYASSEAGKMAMFSIKGGSLRDFELHEVYQSGFPEELFKRSKDKFMKTYSSQAKCKQQRKGETCEVFGEGYRIVLRSEISDNEAKIIRSMHRM